MIILIIIFVALITIDTILTYKVINSGKGVESGKLMKLIIEYPVLTVVVTTLGTLLVLDLIIESGFYLWLIPLDIALLWICCHNWRVLHG